MNNAIEYVLKTWYPKDHPLHNDPLQPAIGLAGEAGELLDLYKKERFKAGISWWDCVHCHSNKESHSPKLRCSAGRTTYYTPKILDELGDLWYYLRILAYQFRIKDFNELAIDEMMEQKKETLDILIYLSFRATNVLRSVKYHWGDVDTKESLFFVYIGLLRILRELNCTLDQLTELNWQKLKDGNNHGWKTS